MFRCGACNQLSAPGETAERVVVETRERKYPVRPQAMRKGRGASARWIQDPGGEGWEVVREELQHSACIIVHEPEVIERPRA